ncbi:ABC transporter substrate-binding protein [Paenibacillus soyae]|uniref:Extracellular solute-binding protein n=1 Tax=Paenibacillus soyae TaxID=2969249 RepID=A0A9X2MV35_9BACL|nr:extracellular solute-binding protein [Paenibacillus soyae]MCR2806418.1 extracellular solute-binding protein [Paenibacillus soyae]
MINGKTKQMLTLALTAILAFALTACSGNGGSGNNGNNSAGGGNASSEPSANTGGSGSTGENVELSFWTLGNVNYEELAKEYMAEHPNVKITIQNTGDQTAHHNNLTTALSAGSGAPDIFQLEIGFMERFINAQDKFYNLNDLGAADLKGDYLDWKWQQASSTDGKFQIGLPTDIAPTVAYYRVDLAEQAGLPTDPKEFSAAIDTWDKFAAVAKQFKDATGKPFVDSRDLIYNALRDQSDGQIYYDKNDGSFIGDKNPQVKKAYDFTVKGIQEGWVANFALWAPEWSQATNEGGFIVLPGPAWMLGNIKSNGPDSAGQWRIAQLPEGAGNWGGSFISLPKEGKHPEEAYAFISWMVNKENQMKTFETKGLMPSIPALFEEPAFKDLTDEFLGGQASATEFAAAAATVEPVYYGPLHDQTDSFIKEALQNVQEKQADPEKEWEAALDKIKRLAARS